MNETIEKPSTELTLPARAAVALGTVEHEVKLRALVKASAGIVAVTNLDGRTECHAAYMRLKNSRIAVEKASKTATEDAKAFSKAVSAEEKRLIAITEAEETRLQALRDSWDAKCEAERQAKIAAERARVDAIKARIDEMRRLPLCVAGRTSTEISQTIFAMVGFKVGEDFEEFQAEAAQVRLDVLDQLAKAETVQRGIEIEADTKRQEAARIKAEQEETAARLKAERAELDARQAEQARQAAIERAAIAEQQRIAKEAQDKLDAERAEFEHQQAAAALEKLNAQLAAEKAERDRLAMIEANNRAFAQKLEASLERSIQREAEALRSASEKPSIAAPASYPFPTGDHIEQPRAMVHVAPIDTGARIAFDDMTPLQRRLHNAACVLDADGDEYGFVPLLKETIAVLTTARQLRQRAA